jgi:hypothetical protein
LFDSSGRISAEPDDPIAITRACSGIVVARRCRRYDGGEMDKHAGKVWTYDDLASLPDDGQRYEILDGELFVSPSPRSAHQRVLLRLVKQLLALEASGQGTVWLSPIDVKMSDTRVVVPDLLAIRTGRGNCR